ncbi:hypothetical protein AB6A40_008405 [Gnathostoma spinigerum]|uniref:HSA domain-containing protein n=1 Tax=Gnathostoma spinigerum TaxID=75299 RepID=A0ABD6EPD6_9BILA
MSSASSRNLRRSRRKTSPPMSYQGSHSDAVPADSVSSSLDLGPRAKVPKLEPPDEDSTSDLRTESLAQMVKRIISLREKLGEFERDLSDASKAGCVSSARTSTTTNFAHSGNYVSKGFAYLEVLDTNVLSAHERSPIPQPATDDVDIPSSSKDENCTVKRCPSNALPPIEIKVDSSANSSCPPFNDQQPSTSFAIHVSQASVSSEVNSRSTPRAGSVVRGPESSVERAAKQEAQVLARVAELRRRGLWTASRLPLCCDPPRNKTHWDYLLEEVRWMAVDFRQERNFKRQAARKFATHIARIARDKELEEERSQLRQVKEAKRICSIIAKMVRDFWQNVDKVVDFHAQVTLLDSLL